MRLDWVRRRLEAWAAWVEESKRGRVASPKIDGMPHAAAAGVPVPDVHEEEKLTQRALEALHKLYPGYSETIALMYVTGPAAHVVGVTALAEWIGVSEWVLFKRIERAESKFSEMLDKVYDARDLGL